MGYIYKIYNDVNPKLYIGQTTHTVEQRFKEHIKEVHNKAKSHIVLYKAMRKYGVDVFHIEIIEECDNALLNEREKYWIKYYNSYNIGYNMTWGGDGGATLSTVEHRKRNGTPVLQYDLQGNFIAEFFSSGEAAEQTGTQQDEINRCCTRSRNAFSANGFIWKRKNDDTPIEIWVNANKNKFHKKAVLQYDLNDNFLGEYESCREANRQNGFPKYSTQISSCCLGYIKTAYHYKWKYKED